MDKYSVEIVPKAEKEFLKLPALMREKIRKQILLLENNPRPFGCKKLKETEYYRLRSGDYRAIVEFQRNSPGSCKTIPQVVSKQFPS